MTRHTTPHQLRIRRPARRRQDQAAADQAAVAMHPTSPAALLQLQRTAGNRAVQQLVARQRAGGHAGPPMVQRRMQGAHTSLVAQGGSVSGKATAKKIFTLGIGASTYDQILTLIKEYEKAEAKGNKSFQWYIDKLKVIKAKIGSWLNDPTHKTEEQNGDNATIARAGALRTLETQVDAEIADLSPKPAKLENITLAANDGVYNGSGHGMKIGIGFDAGTNPTSGSDAMPNSIYGVSFEYWERIEILYDFKATGQDVARKKVAGEGKQAKQWNDIYALAPDAMTFRHPEAGGLTWGDAVQQAANKTLTGKQSAFIYDKPAFLAKTDRHGKRILRFRIVAKDAYGKQEEVYATQVIELGGADKPTGRYYEDTAGNKIVEGSGATETENTATQSAQVLGQDVPQAANTALPAFVQLLRSGGGDAFVNSEVEQIKRVAGVDWENQNKTLGRVGENDVELAGVNNLPTPQSGQVFKQYALSNGGLLVAIMQGSRIIKMYYTNNRTRAVTRSFGTVNLRSFAEIPVEITDSM
jgi:hypothetical protein